MREFSKTNNLVFANSDCPLTNENLKNNNYKEKYEDMARLNREQYISEEAKSLNEQYKAKLKVDKESKICDNILEKISEDRQKVIFEKLSRKFATKGENIK